MTTQIKRRQQDLAGKQSGALMSLCSGRAASKGVISISDSLHICQFFQCFRSLVEEVDEREIFKGSENRLVMSQTYTHEFLCRYALFKYPFDQQVINIEACTLSTQNLY